MFVVSQIKCDFASVTVISEVFNLSYLQDINKNSIATSRQFLLSYDIIFHTYDRRKGIRPLCDIVEIEEGNTQYKIIGAMEQ